ncbi:TPA: DUF294 nucleotidyltransferase-like domain-containing protein [Vibrio parahaemolyticus]|uniref:DUF294 nucleotidyltransferase-like domain-containing protein n=1 Tax=Vibrio harveyi group TaxID=717610 RepID=UPI001B814144|nr:MULTISPECIES: DUF294 nucleotidyltransferase-like domain-containing protein [Vibrio harveyi group]MCG6221710.1 DUF294 nucleotidyltransferase-like domain-containing protein [Vibrio diabolicus]MCR9881959.1 DUF294 nucleotidyltransferase-like domain-containing protein [Vibrio parahaemolyticus]MCR9896631.1 DUF294 nucleotidyltransferase-like domain-containing protein [Vibrio parahaemolyticus]MCZ6399993.1 DUF294 nucleotidyltransferase-like domain-containing protein [Vibrio alginolyticus]HBC3399995.
MDSTLLPNVVAFLKTIAPFSQLPDEVLDRIASDADILFWGQQQHIALNDASERSLYILRSGVIEQRFPNGSLRARLGKNDLFGFNLVQDNYRIETVESCLVYKFNYELLLAKLANFASIANQFATNANHRLQSRVDNELMEAVKGVYFKSVQEVAHCDVVMVAPSTSIQRVAQQMRDHQGSTCALVLDEGTLVGIVSQRNLSNRVVADAMDVRGPIRDVMTPDPYTLGQDELVLAAVNLMMKHNIQHVPIVDRDHQVVGLVTPKQLVQEHGVQAIYLIEKIRNCDALDALSKLIPLRESVFEAMVEAHMPAQMIGQVLTMIYDAFTSQLLKMAEQVVGKPPCRYAWIVAGSHARAEVHLGSDQDNALVLEDGATETDRIYFQHLAMFVCKGLAACGYSLCNGRFMAATSKWNQPLYIWQQYYRKWANNPEYDMLLNLNVFLEIRLIAGDESLFEQLDQHRHECVTHNPRLMSALVRNLLKERPPLGIFNNLVLQRDASDGKTLNIKKAAIGLLVDIARIYALSKGGEMRSTEERIEFAYEQGLINESSYQDLIGTYRYVTQLRYAHHLNGIREGKGVSNSIYPERFGSFERQHLKDAFRIIGGYQDALKMKFGS